MSVATWLTPTRQADLDAATAALETALAHRLVAVLLVGPAARPAAPATAEPELLVIVSAVEMSQIRNMANGLRRHLRAGLRFRTITQRELARACDVFALDIAEWGTNHVLLRGEDPFVALEIDPADLRRGLERELRGLATELRNRVIHGLALEDEAEKAQRAVAHGLDRLLVAAHHTLVLLEREPPEEPAALLRAYVEWAGGDPEPILELWGELQRGPLLRPPLEGLAVLLPMVGLASVAVDHLPQ